MSNGFYSTLQFHGKALVLRAERQTVLAGNIANADTPGFKARDVNFAAELVRATGGGATAATAGAATRTDGAAPLAAGAAGQPPRPGHLPLTTAAGRGTDDNSMLFRRPEQASIDGNTVELDRERAAFADNTVRYEATLRFINGHVRTMLSAIKGE
jgi:flagellar basal-body rod protein FlgB